ncbi:MAG TPA: hypothetical protein VFA54_00715 [Bryobacterales bacterium]|nr:hypothetical protein [Bryobacterales bacterium]
MDDDLQKFEAELKALRPAVPSRELMGALERRLAPRRMGGLFWLGLPAAAAACLLLVLHFRPEPAANRQPPATASMTETAPALKPVAADDVLVDTQDEGFVTLADGTQARRTRQSFVDTITWEDPATHASLRWSVPREEVNVLPVNFQ